MDAHTESNKLKQSKYARMLAYRYCASGIGKYDMRLYFYDHTLIQIDVNTATSKNALNRLIFNEAQQRTSVDQRYTDQSLVIAEMARLTSLRDSKGQIRLSRVIVLTDGGHDIDWDQTKIDLNGKGKITNAKIAASADNLRNARKILGSPDMTNAKLDVIFGGVDQNNSSELREICLYSNIPDSNGHLILSRDAEPLKWP